MSLLNFTPISAGDPFECIQWCNIFWGHLFSLYCDELHKECFFVSTQGKLKTTIRSETDFGVLQETCGLWSEFTFYEMVLPA
jgi:hypothetical protein